MAIKAIVCIGAHGVMGLNGSMPWGDKPLDGAFFRSMTINKYVVMGRKTFDSMGKALPNRMNIVLSRNLTKTFPDAVHLVSIDSVVQFAKNIPDDVWIIGGAQLYEDFLPYIEEFYVTTVGDEFEGDVHFPDIHKEYRWDSELIDVGTGTTENGEEYSLVFRKFTKKEGMRHEQ